MNASELRVGVDESTAPPLCCEVPGTPDFRGFEVDLLESIAGRLGLCLHSESLGWEPALERLLDARLDMLCRAVTITSERSRVVGFSDPYLETAALPRTWRRQRRSGRRPRYDRLALRAASRGAEDDGRARGIASLLWNGVRSGERPPSPGGEQRTRCVACGRDVEPSPRSLARRLEPPLTASAHPWVSAMAPYSSLGMCRYIDCRPIRPGPAK